MWLVWGSLGNYCGRGEKMTDTDLELERQHIELVLGSEGYEVIEAHQVGNRLTFKIRKRAPIK